MRQHFDNQSILIIPGAPLTISAVTGTSLLSGMCVTSDEDLPAFASAGGYIDAFAAFVLAARAKLHDGRVASGLAK